MRNFLKWAMPLASLALFLPAAQAWHHHAVYVSGGAPAQSYPVQSISGYGAQSYLLQPSVQSISGYGAQSYLLQPSAQNYSLVVSGQSAQAQGVGLDIGSLLLNRLLQGGLGNTTVAPSVGGSSDLVNELKANTTALQANTAALKALTKAYSDDSGGGNSSNNGGKLNPLAQLTNPGGVSAESLPVLAQAYAQMMAQAEAKKTTTSAPAQTSADLLTEAEAQIDLANRSAIQAKRYLDYVEAKGQSQAVQLKTLRGQLQKIGVAPTTTTMPTPTPTPMPEPKKPG